MNRTLFDPGPLAAVDCQANDDRWTLVFVRDLPHPPRKAWAALTDPAQLAEWSPYTGSGITCTMLSGGPGGGGCGLTS